MSDQTFSQPELMDLLVSSVGMEPTARTDDPAATFTDLGLDSLAFLQVQTELHQRYGVSVDDDSEDPRVGDLVTQVNERRGVSA